MIKSKTILCLFIFVIVFQIFSSCKERKTAFNGEVYKIEKGGFGYKIFIKEKIYIKQENIPTISGNISFKDSIDALRVMDLVIEKLNEHKFPTVNENELKELKIKI